MSRELSGLEPLARTATGRTQIHLLGFMGCGKSTVARLLAQRLVWNYLDLDVLVARHVGMSIPEIFAVHGEATFRDAERHALRQAVQKPRTVVALGGGTPVDPANRALMSARALSVWLRVDFDVCRVRAGQDGMRPLFDDVDAARLRFAERQSIYAAADVTVDAADDPAAVAAAVEAVARGTAATSV
jgi:shikimate kinase